MYNIVLVSKNVYLQYRCIYLNICLCPGIFKFLLFWASCVLPCAIRLWYNPIKDQPFCRMLDKSSLYTSAASSGCLTFSNDTYKMSYFLSGSISISSSPITLFNFSKSLGVGKSFMFLMPKYCIKNSVVP